MDHDIIPLFGMIATLGTGVWMLKIWLAHRERTRSGVQTRTGGAASDERLARVEQAVEAIAIEIERVSEGQRFVTKLLNEKANPLLNDAKAAVPVRRVDTPH
jgi:hypothetical protein